MPEPQNEPECGNRLDHSNSVLFNEANRRASAVLFFPLRADGSSPAATPPALPQSPVVCPCDTKSSASLRSTTKECECMGLVLFAPPRARIASGGILRTVRDPWN